MSHQRFIELFNRYSRIHNQFAAVKRRRDIEIEDLIISPGEMHTLLQIVGKEGIGVTEISKLLYITKSAVSQQVRNLTNKGLIKKVRKPDEERIVCLFPTEKGRKAADLFLGNESSSMRELTDTFNEMSTEQIDTIDFFLRTLETMFDKKLN